LQNRQKSPSGKIPGLEGTADETYLLFTDA
jgi:hypothetical protein